MDAGLFKIKKSESNRLILEDCHQNQKVIKGFFQFYNDGDIIEYSENGSIKVIFHADNDTALIYITNKCNSNCIMCPDSEDRRKRENTYDLSWIMQYIQLLPPHIRWFDITGGEPTLIMNDLLLIIDKIYELFPFAHIMLLSNGRAFSDKTYCKNFRKYKNKKFVIEVPIHGPHEKLHDFITQSKGSFRQTCKGIQQLINNDIKVTVRIVVSKLNLFELTQIIDCIHLNFANVECVNIMGLEMLGNAFRNREDVWIDFSKQKEIVEKSIVLCYKCNLIPKLFNYPLCLIDKGFWTNYCKSITPSKVTYHENCEKCLKKDDCGGFFMTTMKLMEFVPISL